MKKHEPIGRPTKGYADTVRQQRSRRQMAPFFEIIEWNEGKPMSENEQDPNGASEPKASDPILRPGLRRLGLGSPEPSACVHKWVVIDKLPQPSSVVNEIKGIAYIFHCERCLEIATRLLS